MAGGTVVRFKNGTAVLYPGRLFGDLEEVGRWTREIADEMGEAVRDEAPVRTFALRNSVDCIDFRQGVTSRGISLRVGGSTARHAEYVIGGTDGGWLSARRRLPSGVTSPINTESRYSPGSSWPKKKLGRGEWINGQRANDFVARGLAVVAADHEALHGLIGRLEL